MDNKILKEDDGSLRGRDIKKDLFNIVCLLSLTGFLVVKLFDVCSATPQQIEYAKTHGLHHEDKSFEIGSLNLKPFDKK